MVNCCINFIGLSLTTASRTLDFILTGSARLPTWAFVNVGHLFWEHDPEHVLFCALKDSVLCSIQWKAKLSSFQVHITPQEGLLIRWADTPGATTWLLRDVLSSIFQLATHHLVECSDLKPDLWHHMANSYFNCRPMFMAKSHRICLFASFYWWLWLTHFMIRRCSLS